MMMSHRLNRSKIWRHLNFSETVDKIDFGDIYCYQKDPESLGVTVWKRLNEKARRKFRLIARQSPLPPVVFAFFPVNTRAPQALNREAGIACLPSAVPLFFYRVELSIQICCYLFVHIDRHCSFHTVKSAFYCTYVSSRARLFLHLL